ncbi:hypothetical protein BpHYR1_053232 [Brachionus plicatilis]|uniref:Uncharacterized protein n=1 Tax=Brachionus plicatilis TaxID=10195 RepID=A0A3M7SH59_BRAPC|nr:hypothetical protein BpHYR1_053232 [Brachionus plicatilis]
MITYQNPKYCVAHVKQRWLKRKKTRQNLVKSAQIGCNRVNRSNPFGPHIINRGAKGRKKGEIKSIINILFKKIGNWLFIVGRLRAPLFGDSSLPQHLYYYYS